VIFALFMMACTCGASMATMVGDSLKAKTRLMIAFGVGIGSFMIAAIAASSQGYHLAACFTALLVFEFCCGFYFPSVGVLKSDIVPEHIRGTMYNIYRLPLNAVVICLLLSNISMIKCFGLCAFLLTIALVSVVGINVPAKAAKATRRMALSDPVGINIPAKARQEVAKQV